MQMEVQGNHTDLFLNDLHKHTHGCPKFVAMTMEERVQVGTAAKLCLSCISHTVTFSHTHLTECKRRKQAKSGDKSEYACQVDRCNFNICTCVRHKTDPAHASTLTKRKAQMTQRGLTVGMVTIMPTIPTNTQPWGGGQACLPHHTPTAVQLGLDLSIISFFPISNLDLSKQFLHCTLDLVLLGDHLESTILLLLLLEVMLTAGGGGPLGWKVFCLAAISSL